MQSGSDSATTAEVVTPRPQWVVEVKADGTKVEVHATIGMRVTPEVNFALAAKGVRVLELKSETPHLEELFLDKVRDAS